MLGATENNNSFNYGTVVGRFFLQGTPPAERLSRAKKSFLDEDDQKKLQHEGKVVCLLTAAALRKHDLLTGATELRQFVCPTCNHPWWTHVPQTEPISTCHYCEVCYDALDREKEFGIGRFICLPCDHTFYARCEATEMQDCFKCGKLTGPPYINPRFKPMTASLKSDFIRPRIHRIINASTPHESSGFSPCIAEDSVGSDIFVQVETRHSLAEKPYSKPEDEPVDSQADSGVEVGSIVGSMVGEVSDLESEDSSDSDDSLKMDKMSAQESEPDFGIDAASNVASSNTEVYFPLASFPSYCMPVFIHTKSSDYSAQYPGIVFSKQRNEAKITKDGGEIVGEGIRLLVPPGAVPEGDEANISLQACLGGPFNLPDNMVFMSPVFLIEPPFAFRDEVTLSIDMFVEVKTEEDCAQAMFVSSSTKGVVKEERLQWDLKPYSSPNFTVGSRRGEVKLTHFCFAAFAGFGSYLMLYNRLCTL